MINLKPTKLQAELISKGLTASVLASKLNISVEKIEAMLNRRAPISFEMCECLRSYGVDPNLVIGKKKGRF